MSPTMNAEGGAVVASGRLRLATLGLMLACLAVSLLAVFRPILFHDRQFAFQDAGHYYYPLLKRVQQEWDAGRWPLWAPEASAGTPLLGNPTAAVLYPGKIVFAVLPFPWAFRVYAIGHVAIAFGAMVAMLRGWRVSPTGSILGGLAYAFGVPVLSQTSNVIFLVGAAWAPLGFLAADRWVRDRRRLALPGLAAVLALQVLGGDPETAYLTLVCATGSAAGLAVSRSSIGVGRAALLAVAILLPIALGLLGLSWWSARANQLEFGEAHFAATVRAWRPPTDLLVIAGWGVAALIVARRWKAGRDPGGFGTAMIGLVGASALGLAIAGAQVLPIVESSALSFRAAESGLFHDIYPYSAHPLQFLDAIWPNVFGTLEGGYRSWLNALPPKPSNRVWMPSVYLGGLTLVLAIASATARGGPPWRPWLVAVAVACLLGSLGYYGSPMLWGRWAAGPGSVLGPLEPASSWQIRTDGQLRDGDGGAYWFLASILPGFDSFRYPAKLLVLWSLAVSGLAGAGWDRLAMGRSRRAVALAIGLLALSVSALAASWLAIAPLHAWFDGLARSLRASDEPLDVARAIHDLRAGIVHGSVALALVLVVLMLAPRRPRLAGAMAIVGLSLDLIAANAYHVVHVPQSVFEETSRALEIIRDAERANPAPGPFRVQRVGRWWPNAWGEDASGRDFETIARWEHDTLRPLWNLPLGVPSALHFDTLEPVDYGLFFLPWSLVPDRATRDEFGLEPDQKVWYHPRRGFDLWNARYFIVPARLIWEAPERGYASLIPKSTYIYPPLGSFDGPGGMELRRQWGATEDFRVLRNEAAFPRAWIVHRALIRPEVRGRSLLDRLAATQEILYQGDQFWRVPTATVRDPREVAWVETDRAKDLDRSLSRAEPDPTESVTIDLEEPQRVGLTAVLRTPGLVVVSDRFAPGWTLEVDGRPTEILRTNRAMRGVALAAGTHRLVFRYDPASFRLGIALSIVGFAALTALIAWSISGAFHRPTLDLDGPGT